MSNEDMEKEILELKIKVLKEALRFLEEKNHWDL